MANFLASLMGIMSMRKYLSDAGIIPYVLVAVLIHCKLLYLVQLFGVIADTLKIYIQTFEGLECLQVYLL